MQRQTDTVSSYELVKHFAQNEIIRPSLESSFNGYYLDAIDTAELAVWIHH